MFSTLKKPFSKRTKPGVKVKLFTGIDDIWLENWEKVITNNDLRYLIVEEKYRNHPVRPILLRDAMDTISDEYFKELGVDLESEEMFVLMQKRIEARDKYINGNKAAKNLIKIFTHQIEQLKLKGIKPDMIKNRMAVSKWNGHAINPKTTTVREFIKLIQLMQEEAESMRKKNQRNGQNNEG